MTELPPLRALRVFETVGRLGSMTKAAQELRVSTGAVSQQIKILEDFLKLPLISRSANGITFTEAGSEYHKAISRSFIDLARAQREIIDSRHSPALIISALPLFASRWLSKKMFTWQRTHPQIKFQLESNSLEPSRSNATFDFRITYAEKGYLFENYLVLFTDSLIPVCSPKLLKNDPPLNIPADLLSYRLLTIDWRPFLSPPPTWKDWFRIAGVDEGEVPDFFIMSLSALAIEAAIDGRGVALAQRSMVQDDLKNGRLVAPFSEVLRLPSPYILGWNAPSFSKEGARDFHRWIAAEARKELVT